MQKGLSPEHGRELLGYALEQLLNRRRVSNKCAGHFQTAWRNITDGRLAIVRDPFDEIAGILILNV